MADLNPGIALCSLVLVWTIESISSSRVLSRGIEGDLSLKFLFSDAAATAWSLAECLITVLLRVVLSGRGDGGRESPRTGDNALNLEEEE